MPSFQRTLVMVSAFAALGGFLYGYDLALIGGAMLSIKEEFDTSQAAKAWIIGACKAGAFIGTFLGGAAMYKYGRKLSIAANSIFFVVGPLVMAFAQSVTALIVGRFIVGLGIGVSAVVVPAYLSEMAPPAIRGAVVIIYEVMLCVGMLASSLVDAALQGVAGDWRWMVGVPLVPGMCMAFAVVALPESPRWLVMKGDLDAALSVLHRIAHSKERGSWTTAGVEQELLMLWSTVEKDHADWHERRSGRLGSPTTSPTTSGRHGSPIAGAAPGLPGADAPQTGKGGLLGLELQSITTCGGGEREGMALTSHRGDKGLGPRDALATLDEAFRDGHGGMHDPQASGEIRAGGRDHKQALGSSLGDASAANQSRRVWFAPGLPASASLHAASGGGQSGEYDEAHADACDNDDRLLAGAASSSGGVLARGNVSPRIGARRWWRWLLLEAPADLASGQVPDAAMAKQSMERRYDMDENYFIVLYRMLGDCAAVFGGPERRAVGIALMLAVFNQITASSSIINYAPEVLQRVGVQTDKQAILLSSLIGVGKTVGVCIGLLLVDRAGRRPLLINGAWGCAVSMFALVAALHAGSVWLTVGSMVVYIAAFAMSWAGVFWVLCSELFSMSIKSAAMSMATAVLFLSGALTDLVFPGLVAGLGGTAFVIFGSLSLLSGVYVYMTVPETKGLSLLQIQAALG